MQKISKEKELLNDILRYIRKYRLKGTHYKAIQGAIKRVLKGGK
jgi:hypothetical protein